uniref:Sortilin C-terminal domain-containing protein n=1 Tax=Timema bartmani TaxID=61472 RepID=A0A7R9EYT5_9NEOP|nr:unnamed protein product [Timema bartmani]
MGVVGSDFGFVHNIVLHTCIRNKSSSYDPYAVPSSCKPGNFYNQTKGYRKIPGDACEGGNDQLYLPARLPCPYKEKKEFLIVAQRQRIIRVDLEDPKLEILPISQNLAECHCN